MSKHVKYNGDGIYSGDDKGVNIIIRSGLSVEVSDAKADYLLKTFPGQFEVVDAPQPPPAVPPVAPSEPAGAITSGNFTKPIDTEEKVEEPAKTEEATAPVEETTNSDAVETTNSPVEETVTEEETAPTKETKDDAAESDEDTNKSEE